jgi:hypothetical protein
VKLIRGDERAEVPVERITPVDATGAGDQFAAGFLYGMATGQDLEMAGRMGVAAAAEVIRHIGPRPKRPLKDAFRRKRADLTAEVATSPHPAGLLPFQGFGVPWPHSWRIESLPNREQCGSASRGRPHPAHACPRARIAQKETARWHRSGFCTLTIATTCARLSA